MTLASALLLDVRAEIFLDAGSLAFQATQVVQLRAAHLAATLQHHRLDRRAVRLEHALDAGAVRDLAHGEGRVQARVLARDDHAFVGLHALAVAFLDLHVDDHGVARARPRREYSFAPRTLPRRFSTTDSIDGLCDWNTRSTPVPCEILRTVKAEFRPAFLRAMTTPS